MTGPSAVLAYHDRTKHHVHRFARSAGHLDWATQPEAFRTFAGAPVVELLVDGPAAPVMYDDLYRPGVRDPEPVDLGSVSDWLLHSLAVSAWKQAGGERWALRVDPSSGNLHPTEGYLVLPAAEGIGERPGVYHYGPRDHVLERRAELGADAWAGLGVPPGGFLVGLTSIHWREAWKYGERAFRYCQHDCGHAVAALRLGAALRGWELRILPWSHDTVAALLGLDREADFPVVEEREEPELVALVSPRPKAVPAPGEDALARIAGAAWTGRANRLSEDHVAWDAVEEAAAGSRLPENELPTGRSPDWPSFPAIDEGRPSLDARDIVRTRRSGVAFDPDGRTDRETLLRILDRTLPRMAAPWDALPWSPAIHLAIFVHQVEGVPPGLHLLIRDPAAEESLRAALRDEFLWERPPGVPDGFPLRLLASGDVRDLAARLSCGQEIAGDSFFSLGMIAAFEGPLREHGPSHYRRLFWEAGMIGQVLYLEAEAAGVRGTGIGCYFDDAVHEVLGLEGRDYQSLYHFTVGVPVEDSRLTTLPAYPVERSRSARND